MATNLVSQVMQFLTPGMVSRIAGALGLDRKDIQTAVGAAVPALLAGLSSTATHQASGAQKLANAAKLHKNTIDDFAGTFATVGQSPFIERGSQMVSSLLGSRDETTLASAVGKVAGISQRASSALLGVLGPIVMGTIAKQGNRYLDANSIVGLLADQTDNIAAAMPSELDSLLSGTGLLDSLGGAARMPVSAGDTGQRAAGGAAAAASVNWAYWLIPLVAAGFLLVYLFNKPPELAVQQSAITTQNTVAGLEIDRQVTDSITSLRATLTGITDTASAQAALPKLQDITARIGKLGDRMGQLPADKRKALSGQVNPSMPTLNAMFDEVLAIPGVAEVLKPTLDTLKMKLAGLAAYA